MTGWTIFRPSSPAASSSGSQLHAQYPNARMFFSVTSRLSPRFQTGKLVLEVLVRANRELGTTTAVITHNAAIAAMADRVVRMHSGQITSIMRNERKALPEEIEW